MYANHRPIRPQDCYSGAGKESGIEWCFSLTGRGEDVAKFIMIDEFHLTVSAPRGRPNRHYAAMRRAMDRMHFHAELRRAVRAVLRRHSALAGARITISR
jgi:hypothetical protein